MVSAGQLAAFAALVVVMIVTPGPSVLFAISRALTLGRRDALLTIASNSAGVYAQVVAVAFGLGAIIERSVTAFLVVKFAGAAYLVYLGVQAWRHRRSLADVLHGSARAKSGHTLRILRDGFVVGVTNPKSIIFLAAVLPTFVAYDAGSVPVQILLLGLLLPLTALVTDTLWALAAGTARDWFARTPRRLSLIGGAGGLTMIGLGIGVAFTGRRE